MSKHLQQKNNSLSEKLGEKTGYKYSNKESRKGRSAIVFNAGISANSIVLLLISAALYILIKFVPIESNAGELLFILPCAAAVFAPFRTAVLKAVNGQILSDELLSSAAVILAVIAVGAPKAAMAAILLLIINIALSMLLDKQYTLEKEAKTNQPVKAAVEREDGLQLCTPKDVGLGEIVYVAPGELIPLDGEIVEGSSAVDAYPLTGEYAPAAVSVGSEVIAGCINCSNPIRIKVTKLYTDTLSAGIAACRENIKDSGTVFSGRVKKFTNTAVYILVALAVMFSVFIPLLTREHNWNLWLGRAAVMLWIACFGSVKLSSVIPLSFGMYIAQHKGEIFKDAVSAEAFSRAESIIFNKTGTVTSARYSIADVCAKNMDEEELLDIAALAESCTDHPIGLLLRAVCASNISEHKVLRIEEIPGRGIISEVDGRLVAVGNSAMFLERGILYDSPRRKGLAIHVAIDNKYCGYIIVNDKTRENAFDSLEMLRLQGVKNFSMLTCDVLNVARTAASSLNFDMVKAELTTDGKLSALEYLIATKPSGTTIAFVGDRDNELSAVKRADVGISMDVLHGREGFQAADIAIIDSDLKKLAHAHNIATSAMRICRRATLLLLTEKALLLVLILLGAIPFIAFAVTDTVIQIIAVLYCLEASKL